MSIAEGGDGVGINERRQAIWHTLCCRRHVTIAYLAAEFKISQSTVRDDVDVLSLSYPIISKRGNGGGIKVADWFDPSKQWLSPAQMDLLLRVSKTLTGADAHIMCSIITQLSAVKTHHA